LNIQAEVQQTKSFGIVIIGDRQNYSLVHGTAEDVEQKTNFKQTCFEFSLSELAMVS